MPNSRFSIRFTWFLLLPNVMHYECGGIYLLLYNVYVRDVYKWGVA